MISNNISKRVITLGCDYKTTKGGISTVICNYSSIYSTFRFIPTSKCKGSIRNLFDLLAAIIRFVTSSIFKKTNIIHIHTASNNSFLRKRIFIYIAKFLNKKIVLHVHGGAFKEFTEKNRKTVASTIAKVDTIVTLSYYWKEYFEKTYPNKKVITIPNIVEEPRPIARANDDKEITKAVFLGLICDNKGIFDLIETINEHKEYLKDKFRLYIGGNGDTKRLCDYIEQHNLSDIIVFKGWVDYNKKAELLSQSDVFILPSYIEGVPISILEAMSYKLPIISTNIGGIPEIVKDGENGYLHTPGDKVQLFNHIKSVIKSQEKNAKMGIDSYIKVQPHLPNNVSQSLETMYNNLLNNK